ncbi:hypothetical protein HFO98_18625 [Rhizobium leguminosarum]|nr:hypothetical protein [Rhizobium leguminosarum]MBY5363794.1 hypothetical protein [Rhizobium leguminosarum]MBY5410441.1 hypothetical protein [Rhizobium leguminosarum]
MSAFASLSGFRIGLATGAASIISVRPISGILLSAVLLGMVFNLVKDS